MNGEVLIDLGPKWGHVLPLSVLESIRHIKTEANGEMSFGGSFPGEERVKIFKSAEAFTVEERIVEKHRLMGYSNGLIRQADLDTILDGMSQQSGMAIDETFEEPAFDISMIRQLWATHEGLPYFRISLQYDPIAKQISVDEQHNEDFMEVPEEWINPIHLRDLTEEEKVLLFVYDAVYRMVEGILPEEFSGGLMDPMANIPQLGTPRGSVKTQIDLASIDKNDVFMTTRKD